MWLGCSPLRRTPSAWGVSSHSRQFDWLLERLQGAQKYWWWKEAQRRVGDNVRACAKASCGWWGESWEPTEKKTRSFATDDDGKQLNRPHLRMGLIGSLLFQKAIGFSQMPSNNIF